MQSTPDAILHLATLYLLSQAGFASTSQAASLSLSDITIQYLRLVAESSVDKAILAGRSKPAAQDVVSALHDLGVGHGIDELMEYAVESNSSVGIESEGIDDLAHHLHDGLKTSDPIVEMRMIHEDDIPRMDFSSGEEDEEEEEDWMDIDEKPDISSQSIKIRSKSPDFSWLPPLPGSGTSKTNDTTKRSEATISEIDQKQPQIISAPALISDRYRIRIPFASSSLATRQIPFTDPPRLNDNSSLPPTPTSLPSLIQAYNSTKSEPSLTLRQTETRRQAFELLRRQIASPEKYATPSASLSLPNLPSAPRVSPIVPSHSDTLPSELLPINPNPSGTLLSQLVHSIQSPSLPPDLRERLTSLRPPLAQKRDGELILYGPPIRGPDNAALLRAKGKQYNAEDEAWLYATWDSGPKGIKKWGKGELPTGKKVIKRVEGEEIPRRPIPESSINASAGEGKRTVKLSLSRGNTSLSPNPISGMNGGGGGENGLSPIGISSPGALSPGPGSGSGIGDTNGQSLASPGPSTQLPQRASSITLTIPPNHHTSKSPSPNSNSEGKQNSTPHLKLNLKTNSNETPTSASASSPTPPLPTPSLKLKLGNFNLNSTGNGNPRSDDRTH